jgi:hypothetical protein
MLFLAVFSGFLAEYQLEHVIENQREKQFMKLMIADLESDTLEIRSISNEIDKRLQKVDSLLVFLTTQPLLQENIIMAYHYTYPALNNLTFKFNDRTVTQLKNSGNMRIIRNQKVNDGIISYWNEIEKINQAHDRHTAYRTKARDMETRIFNTAELYLKNKSPVDVNNAIRLINPDPLLVKEYANVVAAAGVMLRSIQNLIQNQLIIAKELIFLIKKEYHLN